MNSFSSSFWFYLHSTNQIYNVYLLILYRFNSFTLFFTFISYIYNDKSFLSFRLFDLSYLFLDIPPFKKFFNYAIESFAFFLETFGSVFLYLYFTFWFKGNEIFYAFFNFFDYAYV
jgi:hypothetical protein